MKTSPYTVVVTNHYQLENTNSLATFDYLELAELCAWGNRGFGISAQVVSSNGAVLTTYAALIGPQVSA